METFRDILETNGDKIKCCFCNKTYKERTGLWRHKKHCNKNTDLATFSNILATNYDNLATFSNILATSTGFQCEFCNKNYLHRQGLWRHKQTCNYLHHTKCEKNSSNIGDKDLIMMLVKQNTELMEILKNGTTNNTHNTTTTHTNSHNKAFNLNFFLNETCKNAMNITDFVDSIKLQLSDFIEVGELGYVEGISKIIVKNLNALDETVRPIHCTDKKRETFYVKDENKWEKEEEDMKKIKKVIKKIAYKNERLMSSYKEKYPDYNDPDSKNSDKYSKTVIEALGGTGNDDIEKENKIIRHISRATTINNK